MAGTSIKKLKSSDGVLFEWSDNLEKASVIVRELLAKVPEPANANDPRVVTLVNVNSVVLKKLLDWVDRNHPNEPTNPVDKSTVKNFNDQFCGDMDKDKGFSFEMILAANYLDLKELVDMVCKVVAAAIKGKTADEIRRTFNVSKGQLTPQEEEQIKRENEWCEEK